MIVDIHVHTSDRPMVGLHTADASVDAIERYADAYDIRKLFTIATYFPFKGRGVPNREMLKRIQGNDRFGLIGSLDVMNQLGYGIAELEELAKEGELVGLKLFAGYQTFHVSRATTFPVFELAERYNLPVTIHGGELHHCCSRERRESGDLKCGSSYCFIDKNGVLAQPIAFHGAVKAFPRVNFVIAHLANPHFEELRTLMARYPNVYTDISGQFVSGTSEDFPEYRSMLRDELQKFLALDHGVDRVMFGSDFPIQSFKDTVELVDALNLDMVAKEKILWRNANRVYNLGLEAGGVK